MVGSAAAQGGGGPDQYPQGLYLVSLAGLRKTQPDQVWILGRYDDEECAIQAVAPAIGIIFLVT